ncbi:hypothetical protein ACFLUU_06460 [Chloroflexota bacterium]
MSKEKLSKILRDHTYIGEGKYGSVTMPYPPIIQSDLFYQVLTSLTENNHGGRPAKSGISAL